MEFIRNRLNTIDINNPSTKKQKEFFEIFKENNMELSDIFIDKIIVSPYINFLIENKKEDSNLLSIAFLKLLLRCERLSKIISENAPNLIIEFETILAQDALNNYYQIIKDYTN